MLNITLSDDLSRELKETSLDCCLVGVPSPQSKLMLLLTAASSPAELGHLKDRTQRTKAWGMLWNSRGCSPSIGVLEGMQRRTGSGGSRCQSTTQIDPVGTILIDHHDSGCILASQLAWMLSVAPVGTDVKLTCVF